MKKGPRRLDRTTLSVLQRAVETAFVELNAARSFVHVAAPGSSPPVVQIEGQGAFVTVEDPQPGASKVIGSKAVEGGGVQLAADAAAPQFGVEVEGLEVATSGFRAVAWNQRWAGSGEANDHAGDHGDDGAGSQE